MCRTMALEDLARFIAPKSPERMLAILRCFYGGDGATKASIMRQTGLREKALNYHITRLKKWKILWTRRRHLLPAIYHVEPRAFRVRLDSVLVDPLITLGRPQGPPLYPTDETPVAPTRFVAESTGRCHTCDTITKTNSDNLCEVCFEENGGARHG